MDQQSDITHIHKDSEAIHQINKAHQLLSDGDLLRDHQPGDALKTYAAAVEYLQSAGEIGEAAEVLNQRIGVMLYRSGAIYPAVRCTE